MLDRLTRVLRTTQEHGAFAATSVAASASWSNVITPPPRLDTRTRGFRESERTHFNAGTSYIRTSSVTVPTIAALPSLPSMNLANLDKDSGGAVRLGHEQTLEHGFVELQSVRRAKNR